MLLDEIILYSNFTQYAKLLGRQFLNKYTFIFVFFLMVVECNVATLLLSNIVIIIIIVYITIVFSHAITNFSFYNVLTTLFCHKNYFAKFYSVTYVFECNIAC